MRQRVRGAIVLPLRCLGTGSGGAEDPVLRCGLPGLRTSQQGFHPEGWSSQTGVSGQCGRMCEAGTGRKVEYLVF